MPVEARQESLGLWRRGFFRLSRVLVRRDEPLANRRGEDIAFIIETAEKEVQDTSCRGSGGVPPDLEVPQDWGIRGLIETISALSYRILY